MATVLGFHIFIISNGHHLSSALIKIAFSQLQRTLACQRPFCRFLRVLVETSNQICYHTNCGNPPPCLSWAGTVHRRLPAIPHRRIGGECLALREIPPERRLVLRYLTTWAVSRASWGLSSRSSLKYALGIRTTSKLVVCTDPRRVITGRAPKGALKSLTPHYHYRPPLKRPVFMPSYSCYP